MPQTVRQLKKDKRTKQQKQDDFLKAFIELVSVSAAAKRAKIHRTVVYDWLNEQPPAASDPPTQDGYIPGKFAVKYEAACQQANQTLEDEMIRRGVKGVKKPVYQGGKKVGEVTEYSDTLLICLANARMPEKYKRRVYNEHTTPPDKPMKTETTVTHTHQLPDMSRLTDEELKEFLSLAKKARYDVPAADSDSQSGAA